MKKFEVGTPPLLSYRIKIAFVRGDSLGDTGESGDAYDAEAQTEAQRTSRSRV